MLKAIRDTGYGGAGEIYDVYSGKMVVGRITLHLSGGHSYGTWGYIFNFTTQYPGGAIGPSERGFETIEEAMTAMRIRWEAWLEWAELQEISAPAAPG